MDAVEIAKQMLKDGASDEEVVRALEEDLGLEDAEGILAKAKGGKPKPPQPPAEEEEGPKGLFGEGPEKEEETEEGEGEETGKSLFETPAKKSQTPETQNRKTAPAGAQDERGIPRLEITKVSGEGEEETLDIESMLNEKKPAQKEEQAEAPGAGGLGASGEKRLKGIEQKVDELVALTKALQEINKKILETERQNLLRSK
ncbi:MAG: hypothetical protein WC792_01345 [Candidatus Micrarchaeia archaeon]|jgi:hypothetical protein